VLIPSFAKKASHTRVSSSGNDLPHFNNTALASSPRCSPALPSPPVIQRFPSRVELRAQYDRRGQLVRAVEEFYDHDATMPCLAYGEPGILKSETANQYLAQTHVSLQVLPLGQLAAMLSADLRRISDGSMLPRQECRPWPTVHIA